MASEDSPEQRDIAYPDAPSLHVSPHGVSGNVLTEPYANDAPSLFGEDPVIDISAGYVDLANGRYQGIVSDSASAPTLGATLDQARQSRGHALNDFTPSGTPGLIQRMQKNADDPSSASASSSRGLARQESTTLTTLSRLFAVKNDVSPNLSRHPSDQSQVRDGAVYHRVSPQTTELPALPNHLYTRGLLSGQYSDITIHAFGHQYRLHRLILDQSPFFAGALSGSWLEAKTNDVTIRPDDIDDTITQVAFELALSRLYGHIDTAGEEQDPVGVFATGCWLEVPAMVDSAVESILRQMALESLSLLIKLVTRNYYGRAGDKILASAKCMLCRDGWKMPLRFWDDIPGDVVREIVGGDGFFVNNEWDRWVLTKRILDRRLKIQAQAQGLISSHTGNKLEKAPDTWGLMAVRFDTVYRRNGHINGQGYPDHLHKWVTCYTHPAVEPLLVLLDEGIHYIHLEFEQLQQIRKARDCFGLPVMSEDVISNALWQHIELRQKIINSGEKELEIGLSVRSQSEPIADSVDGSAPSNGLLSGQRPTNNDTDPEILTTLDADIPSGSWDGNGHPRKFWIPSSDCKIVVGGNVEPSANSPYGMAALTQTVHPEDVQWITDFSATISATSTSPVPTKNHSDAAQDVPAAVKYTHFPPFRFSVEFPNPRSLRDKKRVYSRTVFYAGSLWNIYIQKVATSRSKQLGVYLHRAKEYDTMDSPGNSPAFVQGTVVDRISAVERGSAAREERRQRRHHQRSRPFISDRFVFVDDADSSGSAGDHDSSTIHTSTHHEGSREPHSDRNSRGHGKSSQTDTMQTPSTRPTDSYWSRSSATLDTSESMSDQDSDPSVDQIPTTTAAPRVPALPSYIDARPTIRTYFKIYSPSRGGRMLSVYESAPDQFNFSQSWGWTSSNLMLDEGFSGEEENEDDAKEGGGTDGGSGNAGMSTSAKAGGKSRATTAKKAEDGNLRFMVVIGNI
jgi:hypothetical protein